MQRPKPDSYVFWIYYKFSIKIKAYILELSLKFKFEESEFSDFKDYQNKDS